MRSVPSSETTRFASSASSTSNEKPGEKTFGTAWPAHPFESAPRSDDSAEKKPVPNRLSQVWFGAAMPLDSVHSIGHNRQQLDASWVHVIVTDDPRQKAEDFHSRWQTLRHRPGIQKEGQPNRLGEGDAQGVRSTRNANANGDSLALEFTPDRSGLGPRYVLEAVDSLDLATPAVRHEPGRSIVHVDGKPIQFVHVDSVVSSLREVPALSTSKSSAGTSPLALLDARMTRQRQNFFAPHAEASDMARLMSLYWGGMYADTDIALFDISPCKASARQALLLNGKNNNWLAAVPGSSAVVKALQAMADSKGASNLFRPVAATLHALRNEEMSAAGLATTDASEFAGTDVHAWIANRHESEFSLRGLPLIQSITGCRDWTGEDRYVATMSLTGPSFLLGERGEDQRRRFDEDLNEQPRGGVSHWHPDRGWYAEGAYPAGRCDTFPQALTVEKLSRLRARYDVQGRWEAAVQHAVHEAEAKAGDRRLSRTERTDIAKTTRAPWRSDTIDATDRVGR